MLLFARLDLVGACQAARSSIFGGIIVVESAEDAGGSSTSAIATLFAGNRLLATLSPGERTAIEAASEVVQLQRDAVLFDAGGEVPASYFPAAGAMISLVLFMQDGRTVEVATIGKEGAAGGIVSCGSAPAFARAVVQMPGPALRVPISAIESAKSRSPHVRSIFCRYADALLAQVMQSVACNAFHPIEARCCRWLLTAHDRVEGEIIPLTQEYLAEMLGVQRTSVSPIAKQLQDKGMIRYRRGRIEILDRPALERSACECYGVVERHFTAVLPEPKPQKLIDAGGGMA
jgi:CRP-like cAMP-binding protein